jgi:hypothetical protein
MQLTVHIKALNAPYLLYICTKGQVKISLKYCLSLKHGGHLTKTTAWKLAVPLHRVFDFEVLKGQ